MTPREHMDILWQCLRIMARSDDVNDIQVALNLWNRHPPRYRALTRLSWQFAKMEHTGYIQRHGTPDQTIRRERFHWWSLPSEIPF